MKRLSIVTGGTSGIGFSVAKDLAKNSDLALIYHSNHERAENALNEIRMSFPSIKVAVFPCDLGDREQAETVFAKISEWHSQPPSVLINCAGRSYVSFMVTDSLVSMHQAIADNLHSMLNATHFIARQMYRAKTGRIVNFSSTSADNNSKGSAIYSAAKSAIETLTKNLSKELYGRGITLNCVRPGLIRTPMTERLLTSAEHYEKYLVPVESVVAAVRFFLSPEAAAITGQILTVDHGQLRAPSENGAISG